EIMEEIRFLTVVAKADEYQIIRKKFKIRIHRPDLYNAISKFRHESIPGQNLPKQLKGKLGSNFDNFMKDFYMTRNNLTEKQFNERIDISNKEFVAISSIKMSALKTHSLPTQFLNSYGSAIQVGASAINTEITKSISKKCNFRVYEEK
ncbi:12275_t:CDS:2, partial [Rhizophagus irregularis]